MTAPDPHPESKPMALLLAKKFVQRKDVKAYQVEDGGYRPDRTPWKVRDLRDHVEGKKTYGHYLCDQESLVKLFVFDIDFEKTGTWIERPDLSDVPLDADLEAVLAANTKVHQATPRADWLDRRHPGRAWYKLQLRTMVEMLSQVVHRELGMACASAYSGNKGAHVYGFFDQPVPASEARAAALVALEIAGSTFNPAYEFAPTRGSNFYKYTDPSPETGFENLSIELFPKQSSMDDKDLGNLCRLPGGVNKKNPKDQAFFIDQREAHTVIKPHPDPIKLLTEGNPWSD